jgi:hypothetical protein
MTNQQLIDAGRNQMDQTDQAIERSKAVCFPCYAFPICFSALLEQILQDILLVGCSTNS